MIESSYAEAIYSHIRSMPEGSLFVLSDFNKLGTYDSIRQNLVRIKDKGAIRRIIPGVYQSRYSHSAVTPYPTPQQVADKLAQDNKWEIAPCTELARLELGLPANMPGVPTYFSSGPNCRYAYGENEEYQFRLVHVGAKFLSNVPFDCATVISALMDTEKYPICAADIYHLANTLPEFTKDALIQYLEYAPVKLRSVIEILYGQYGKIR